MLYRILADNPDFFTGAFFDDLGDLDVGPDSVSSTLIQLVNASNGLVTRIEGTGLALTPDGDAAGGTVSALTVLDGATTLGTITGVDWEFTALVAALDAVAADNLGPLAALFNETAPISFDASMATGDVDAEAIFGRLVPLVEGVIYTASIFDDLAVGTSDDDQFTVSGGADYSFNQFEATDGNDLYDFSGANQRVFASLDYDQDYSSTPTAILADINGLTDSGSIQAGGFTDTITGMANILFDEGFGLLGSAFGDTFNVVQVQGGWIEINGGEGSDTYNLTLTDDSTIRLVFRYGAWNDPTQGIDVDISSGSIQNDGFGTSDTLNVVDNGGRLEIRGTAFADSITGSARNERFIGDQGDDTIDGGQGWDAVRYDRSGVGPIDADLATGVVSGTWDGEAFVDTLSGIEEVRGSRTGDDTILGSAIDEYFDGRGGDDLLDGGAGADWLFGNDGDDTLIGGAGNDTLEGGADTDRADYRSDGAGVSASLVTNTVTDGGGDTDTLIDIENLTGSGFDDTLVGDGLNNALVGKGGADSILAGAGDDYVEGGEHDDTLDGGSGFDRLAYSGEDGTQGVTVNLVTGIATDTFGNTDQISGFERVSGTALGDLMEGDGGAQRFDGNGGDDTLIGGHGNDTLHGGDGRDQLRGGQGDDMLDASGGSAETQSFGDIVSPGTGRDTIIGHEAAWRAGNSGGVDLIYTDVTGAGGMVVTIGADGSGTAVSNVAGLVDDSFTFVDHVEGTHQSDRLSGSDSRESFVGEGGNDTIDGGGGFDWLEYWLEEGATQGVVVDLSSSTATDSTGGTDTLANIEGAAGTVFSDDLVGSVQNNWLSGRGGDDTVAGGEGADTLDGGDGNDTLDGGQGADLIYGGAGSDSLTGGAGPGSDWLVPGGGNDTVDGGAGNDMVSFSDLAETPGRTNLDYRLTIDLEAGTAVSHDGAERMSLLNLERVTGTIFADFIRGDAGANQLRGLGDYDWFLATTGPDTIDGGNGQDMISFVEWGGRGAPVVLDIFSDAGAPPAGAAVAGVTLDLTDPARSTGLAQGLTLISVERVTGSSYQDVFYGDANQNDFRGLGGYDWFVGSTGGRERYYGGDGIDTVTYFQSSTGVIASLRNGAGEFNGQETGYGSGGDAVRDLYFEIENLVGTQHRDRLEGNSERNQLAGLGDDDFLYGYGGIDYIEGGDGNDYIDGGAASDYALYDGTLSEYTITRTSATDVTITGRGYTDTLTNVEYFQFDDATANIWEQTIV